MLKLNQTTIVLGLVFGALPLCVHASSCMTDSDTKIKYEFDEAEFSKLETQQPGLFSRDITPTDIAGLVNIDKLCKKADPSVSLTNVISITSQSNIAPTSPADPNCLQAPGVTNVTGARFQKLLSDLTAFTADSNYKKINLDNMDQAILTRFNEILDEQKQRDEEKKERAGGGERVVKQVGVEVAKGAVFGPGNIAGKYAARGTTALLRKIDFANWLTNQGTNIYKMKDFLPPNTTGIQILGLVDGLQKCLTAPVSILPVVGQICSAGSGAASLTLKSIALTKCRGLDKRTYLMARANEHSNEAHKIIKEGLEEGVEYGTGEAMETIFGEIGDAVSGASGDAVSQAVPVAGVMWGMMNGGKTLYRTFVSGFENGRGHETLWALEKVYKQILDEQIAFNLAKALNFSKEVRSLKSINPLSADQKEKLKKSNHCACEAMLSTSNFRRYAGRQFENRDNYLRAIIRHKHKTEKVFGKDRNKGEIQDAKELITDIKDEMKSLKKEIEDMKQAYQKLGGDVSALDAQLAQLTEPTSPARADGNRTEWYDHAKAWKDQLNSAFGNYNIVSRALYDKFRGKLQTDNNGKVLSKLNTPAQCSPIQLNVFKQRALRPAAAGNAAPPVSSDDGKAQLKRRTFGKDLDAEHQKLNDGKVLLKQINKDLKVHPLVAPSPSPAPSSSPLGSP